ncbi:MAG: DUF134 domain-containing protein [Bacillota bacterium]
MPRPHKPRQVEFIPEVTLFKPAGIPLEHLEQVVLSVDEVEALRLKDLEDLNQDECAERMGVAQSTLQRILSTARAKVASALVKGRAIRIEGGHYHLTGRCRRCGHSWEKESNNRGVCPQCHESSGPPPWAGRGSRVRQ